MRKNHSHTHSRLPWRFVLILIFAVILIIGLLVRAANAEAPSRNVQEFSWPGMLIAIPRIPSIWDGYAELKIICSCESGLGTYTPHQFEPDGTPLWSHYGTKDVGACQIHAPLHLEPAEAMGLDIINSFEDNVAYAKFLYDTSGSTPWNASAMCWRNPLWYNSDDGPEALL